MIAPDWRNAWVSARFHCCRHYLQVLKLPALSPCTGTYLPERDAGIRVFDDRHTTVRVHLLKRVLLQIAEVHDLGLSRNVELIEDDGDFPWIRSLRVQSVIASRLGQKVSIFQTYTCVRVELDRLEVGSHLVRFETDYDCA